MSKGRMATKRAHNKPAPTPKRSQRPKVAARAQRKKQALIRSPKDQTSRHAVAGSHEASTEVYHEPREETRDNRARAAALQTILQASLQNASDPKMGDNIPGRGLDFFGPFASMQAYQAKFLEVTQANTQFTFEFILRLAKIRSPLEFWAVIAEFTVRRILTIGKDAKELAALSRPEAIRDVALLGR